MCPLSTDKKDKSTITYIAYISDKHFPRPTVHGLRLQLGPSTQILVSRVVDSLKDFKTKAALHSALASKKMERKHLLERHQLSRKIYIKSKIACERMKKQHPLKRQQISCSMALQVKFASQRLKIKHLLERQQLSQKITLLRMRVLRQQRNGISNSRNGSNMQ